MAGEMALREVPRVALTVALLLLLLPPKVPGVMVAMPGLPGAACVGAVLGGSKRTDFSALVWWLGVLPGGVE